jgi:hypothetical protein
LIRTSGSRLLQLSLALCAVLAWAPVRAADGGLVLVMYTDPDCGYCTLWESEVGVVYARTVEGRRAPLVRRPLTGAGDAGASLSEPVRFTPTFVLLRAGREVGRITGYPGEAHFWGLLASLLQRSKDE